MKKPLFSYFLLLCSCLSFSQAPTSWQSRGIGGGGALFAPSVNPADHNEMYIGCDMSELFHTADAGKHWGEINFTQVQGGHDSYVCFTNNPNLRYVVDYTSVNGNDLVRPMKTTNGGTTWSVLSGDPYGTFPDAGIERLFADYDNPNNVVIADYSTVYFSSNGGNSFTQIHTAYYNGVGNHIAGVFFDGTKIYIASYDGMIYSNNGGTTFSMMPMTGFTSPAEKMISFSGAKEGSTVRFICLTGDSGNVYSGFQYGSDYNGALAGVYTMDNASGTWTSKMSGISVGNDFPDFCGMANNDIDTMYIAGGSNAGDPIVMRATASTNWNHIFNTGSNQNIGTGWCGAGGPHQWSYAEAFFGFQVCPNSSKIILLGDYGFAHTTNDAGATWHQQYVDVADENPIGSNTPSSKFYHGIGLENTTNWQVMWSDPSHLFAPFSDITGVTSADSGKSWNFIPGLTQNSTYRIIKHSNGNIYAATSTVHDMYQSTRIYDAAINGGSGAVYFSTNGGTSFSVMHNFAHPVMWVAADPSNSNRLYAAVAHGSTNTGGIYVTNNLSAGTGATWTKLPKPPRSNGHAFNINVLNNGDLVVSFCARKPTTSTGFTDSSGVYYYDLANTTWYDRSATGMHYWTKDVVIDPNDATQSTWYAAVFSGWGNVPAGTGGVYKTTNKGVSWTQVSNSYRVNSITVNPANANELFFTTETDGLWYTSNATNTTPTFSPVSSYPFRHPVRVFYNPFVATEIWVSSFGNGMMMGSTVNTTGISEQIPLNNDQLRVYPNPFSDKLNIVLPENGRSAIKIFSLLGTEVYSGEFWNRSVSLDIKDLTNGIYIVESVQGTKKFVKKMVKE
ncbi:MAG: T9SS type A sorting domain-containing protein [Bacteroidia bacterium]